MSIEVRPVSLLRRFGRACKVARIRYRYTYEVDGVAFHGAASVVEDIDIAYDPRVHAKKSIVASQLPIRFLEISPQNSSLNLSTLHPQIKTTSYPRSPFKAWPPVISCLGGLLILFAGWRIIAWKYMRHSPSSAPAEMTAYSDPRSIKISKNHAAKNMRSIINSKKSNTINAERLTSKR